MGPGHQQRGAEGSWKNRHNVTELGPHLIQIQPQVDAPAPDRRPPSRAGLNPAREPLSAAPAALKGETIRSVLPVTLFLSTRRV